MSAGNRDYALGRLKTGTQNKTEAAYQSDLEVLKFAGEIIWFAFERYTFRLADDTRYTPDFAVMAADGVLEFHEVKGFWRDDARVKIKVAADRFPHRFIAVKSRPKKHGGGWEKEVIT
jgi:hypothetical protein